MPTNNDDNSQRLWLKINAIQKEQLEFNWRLKDIDSFMHRYAPKIDTMIKEREIEKEVKKRMQNQNKLYLTTTQRIAAVTIFVIAVVDFVHTFWG